MCMKKLLFLFLLSPLTYSYSAYYCESNSDDYLRLKTNYWDMEKKNKKSQFDITFGQTKVTVYDAKLEVFNNLSYKSIKFEPETIHENYFGVIAYDDYNYSIYQFNYVTDVLTVAIYNPLTTDEYINDKKKIGIGEISVGLENVKHVYGCEYIQDGQNKRREEIEQGQLEAPFK